MSSVEVMQVIRIRLVSRGKGSDADPARVVDQYWSMDGEYLAEYDPAKPTHAVTGKDFANVEAERGGAG